MSERTQDLAAESEIQDRMSATPTHKFAALDGLRGICACAVVAFHFQGNSIVANLPLLRNGWLFVDFFFVLSGFVIAASYGERLANGFPLSRFLILRLGRVYPLHCAVLLLYLVAQGMLALLQGSRLSDIELTNAFFAPLFLVQIFGVFPGPFWNPPSWSIAAETWTYLLSAVVLSRAGKYSTLAIVLSVVITGAWLASTPEVLRHDFDLGLVRCLFGFGLGLLAFKCYCELEKNEFVVKGVWAEPAITALAIFVISFGSIKILTLAAPPIFFLVVLIYACQRGSISSLLTSWFAQLLGHLSYSIYMIHVFVLGRIFDVLLFLSGFTGMELVIARANGVKVFTGPALLGDLVLAVILTTIVAASWLTYNYLESPARELSRQVARGIARSGGRHQDASRQT